MAVIEPDDYLVAAADPYAVPHAQTLRQVAALNAQIARVQQQLDRAERLLARKPAARTILADRITTLTGKLTDLRAARDAQASIAAQLAAQLTPDSRSRRP